MNIVLVDDEVLMIEALKKIIRDSKLDVAIAGEAYEGVKALEMMETLRPDLAIIDIRMPKMDGLQLIQALKERGLNTKVLILSAYRDFDYAQKAIQLGASGYLVKPVDRVKLTEELSRVMQKIHDESNVSAMMNIAAESIPLLRTNYLRQLLNRNNRYDEAQGRQLIDMGENDCQLMLVSLDAPQPLGVDMERQIADCVDGILKEQTKGAAFFSGSNELAVVFNSGEGLNAAGLADAVRQAVNVLIPFGVDIGISREGFSLGCLVDAYKEAADALPFKFYLGPNAIIHRGQIEGIRFLALPVLFSNADYLIEQIKMGLAEDVQKSFSAAREGLKKSMEMHPDSIYQALYDFLLYIRSGLKSSFTEAELKTLMPQMELKDLKQFRTLGQLFDCVLLQIQNITSLIESKRRGEDSRLIEKVKRYCENNYASDITLEAMSEHVNMAKNYFCSLFKKKTGESFWDYLTKLRISKAKDLLEKTETKIVVISEKVGYKNASHFCRVFKELAGVSPAEYKLKYLKKNS